MTVKLKQCLLCNSSNIKTVHAVQSKVLKNVVYAPRIEYYLAYYKGLLIGAHIIIEKLNYKILTIILENTFLLQAASLIKSIKKHTFSQSKQPVSVHVYSEFSCSLLAVAPLLDKLLTLGVKLETFETF
jgi:hypothetical protein